MKKKLLLTGAAMALAIGCTTAVAQEGGKQRTGADAIHSQGSAQHQQGPGGASGPGATRQNLGTPSGGAAENQAIPDKQGMGPPKGTSQNQERGRSTRQRGAEENGEMMQRGAQENNKTNMQRGAEENSKTNMQRGAEENNKTNMQRGAGENEQGGTTRENRENNARIQERGGRTGSAGGKPMQLSESQRTRIKNLIVKDRNVPRDNSSNFTVSVGSAVPHNVHVAVLPPDVIRVVPEYKGFDYIVVRDQLLIIDPDTMKIVAIMPA
jgi:hypothetical protein